MTPAGQKSFNPLRVHRDMSLPSPIRILPHEMLSEVFVLTLPDSNLYGRDVYTFRRAVMLPGTICKHWRDVALSTPKLWSFIFLVLQEKTREADVDMTRTWLTRSGGLPLSLHLSVIRGRTTCIPPPATHPVISVLVQHAERWEHVTFSIPSSMLNETLPAKNRLPRLRSFCMDYPEEEASWTMPIDTFEVAPLLTSLTISSMALYVFPWTQLTYIRMSAGLSLDRCHQVLRQASNLMECHLRIRDRTPIEPSCPVIHHPHLHKIKLNVTGDVGPLVDRLVLPALRSFDYYEGSGTWPQAQFISLLSRSSCSLSRFSLCFQSARLSDDDLIECLRHMPSLACLELDIDSGAGITDKSLAKLTLPHSVSLDEQANYLVPKIEFMYLYVCHEICEDTFAGMVESRCSSNAIKDNVQQTHIPPLKTLFVDFSSSPCKISSATRARLHDCAIGGLDVREITWDDDGEKVETPL